MSTYVGPNRKGKSVLKRRVHWTERVLVRGDGDKTTCVLLYKWGRWYD